MPATSFTRAAIWSISSGNIQVSLYNNAGVAQLFLIDFEDGVMNNGFAVAIPGSGDFVWRVTKDATNLLLTLEAWNVNGSGYVTFSQPITTLHTGVAGNLQIGDGTLAAGTLAFLRWYSTLLPIGSTAPFGAAGGDLGDWEFNGNGNDSSTHRLNLTFSGGTPMYTTTPIYGPACIMPPQQTFRAGAPFSLNSSASYPLDGTSSLTATIWQQIAGNVTAVSPSILGFNPSVASPVFSGPIAGSYTIQLTVFQANGQSTSCQTKYGFVATDANGSVIISNPVHAKIFGPMIAAFADTSWPLYEQQGAAYSNEMINKLQGISVLPTGLPTQFVDYWNIAAAGTVSISSGSTTVTGVGTSFLSLYCGGTAGPSVQVAGVDPYLFVWYPINSSLGLPSGTTGRYLTQVASCASNTSLTLANAWNGDSMFRPSSVSGVQYAYGDNGNGGAGDFGGIGLWTFGAAPGNYYDDVMALYSQYYRTGIDDYLYWARKMADMWWSFPGNDKGVAYDGLNANISLPNRSMSMTGLWLRNTDNPPYDYSPGLRLWTNYLINGNGQYPTAGDCRRVGPNIPLCGQDIREQGYGLMYVAYDALFDSNPTQASAAATAVSLDMQYRWTPSQQSTGQWVMSDTTGYASWTNSGGVTASVTVGSPIVTAIGGTWTQSNFIGTNGTGPPFSLVSGNWPTGFWLAPAAVAVNNANSSQSVNIASCTTANPIVCTLQTTAPAWLTTSLSLLIYGIAGPGCAISSGTNGLFVSPYAVTSVAGTSITVNVSGANCTAAQTILLNNSQGDSKWYYAQYVDSTHLQLIDINNNPVAYQANNACPSGTCSGLGWDASGLIAYGTQIFMVGIQNRAFYFASLALATADPSSAVNAANFTLSNSIWTASTGLNSTEAGLYYGRAFVSCEPPGLSANWGCDSSYNSSNYVGARTLDGEGINIATWALVLHPASFSSAILGTTMMNAMFLPSASSVLQNMAPNGYLFNGALMHKWFGYFWGIGANWTWPSAVVGGLMRPIPRVVQVSLDFQTATQALLTVVSPDGTSSQVTCTSSPCAVTIDAREGDHLLSIQYLDPVHRVLAALPLTVLKVR